MATWEFIGKNSVQRNLVVRKTASRTSGYGDTYVYDVEPPDVTWEFQTDAGVTQVEAAALEFDAMIRDKIATITDNVGSTWSGRILSFSAERERGSSLYRCTLTLRPTTDEV